MKNAVILARYSCEKQTELSIEGQLDVCYKYAKENDFNIIGEYIDRAESGRTDDREQFQNMMRDAALGTFEAVIVYKFDRFARNKVESVVNKNRLMKLGVKVISATQLIPDAPEGVIFESIIEAYDEYYSLELAQKVLRTFKIKTHMWCCMTLSMGRSLSLMSPSPKVWLMTITSALIGRQPNIFCLFLLFFSFLFLFMFHFIFLLFALLFYFVFVLFFFC